MRSDIFVDKKSIHIKLDKDVHFALRTKLFKYNMSMQELFDEFAQLVVAEAPKAQSIFESIVDKRLRSTLSNGQRKRKKKEQVLDFEADALYNMINGSEDR